MPRAGKVRKLNIIFLVHLAMDTSRHAMQYVWTILTVGPKHKNKIPAWDVINMK